jgi:hypothetical protein
MVPVDERIGVLVEAGLPHEIEEDGFGRTIHVFKTSIATREECQLSQAMWSIIPPEKCLISRPHGSGYFTKELETRVPTTYLYRFLNDDGDRKRSPDLIFLFFPIIFLLFLLPLARIGIATVSDFVLPVIVLLAIWIYMYFWFRHQRWFSVVVAPGRVLGRFLLGAVFGIAWLLTSGAPPSLTYIFGAFWIFTISNLIWMITVDYDRFLFTQRVDEVGGLLPYEEAVSRLRSITKETALTNQ